VANQHEKIIVVCRHSGVLLNYGIMLNTLGYFNLSLCSNMEEAIRVMECKGEIDFFLLDDFKLGSNDAMDVKNVSCYGRVKRFLLVGDFRFDDHCLVFKWAKSNCVSLLGMIRHPIFPAELESYLGAV